jgi:hypothetical protein
MRDNPDLKVEFIVDYAFSMYATRAKHRIQISSCLLFLFALGDPHEHRATSVFADDVRTLAHARSAMQQLDQ